VAAMIGCTWLVYVVFDAASLAFRAPVQNWKIMARDKAKTNRNFFILQISLIKGKIGKYWHKKRQFEVWGLKFEVS
jgi:hypothetical protein